METTGLGFECPLAAREAAFLELNGIQAGLAGLGISGVAVGIGYWAGSRSRKKELEELRGQIVALAKAAGLNLAAELKKEDEAAAAAKSSK